MPGVALTKEQPMIDAMMDIPPNTKGYTTASAVATLIIKAPSTIVAIKVTA
jgi:hypothetical protein